MATLIDTLRSFLTPELLSKTATALGESQGNVSRGMGAALSAILAALFAKSSDTGIMRQIMDLLMNPGVDLSASVSRGAPARHLGAAFESPGPSSPAAGTAP